MRNKKSKFLRALAKANMPEGSVWEDYDEKVVKNTVKPERKKIKDLTDDEKKQYVNQIAAAKSMETDEVEAFIVVPKVIPSITRTLKRNCGKFIYRNLKKLAKKDILDVKLPKIIK